MLTPTERWSLINRPFISILRLTTSYPHAGTLIDRSANGTDDMVSMRRKIERGETLGVATLDELGVLFGE